MLLMIKNKWKLSVTVEIALFFKIYMLYVFEITSHEKIDAIISRFYSHLADFLDCKHLRKVRIDLRIYEINPNFLNIFIQSVNVLK